MASALFVNDTVTSFHILFNIEVAICNNLGLFVVGVHYLGMMRLSWGGVVVIVVVVEIILLFTIFRFFI